MAAGRTVRGARDNIADSKKAGVPDARPACANRLPAAQVMPIGTPGEPVPPTIGTGVNE